MNDYEKLKEVIQAANPEIMELRFGCEIELLDLEYGRTPFKAVITATNWAGFFYNPFNAEDGKPMGGEVMHFQDTPINREEEGLKILGSPIRLADCVFAVVDKLVPNKIPSERDWDLDKAIEEKLYGLILRYNPLDDNLDHQSDECKEFLIELLTSALHTN